MISDSAQIMKSGRPTMTPDELEQWVRAQSPAAESNAKHRGDDRLAGARPSAAERSARAGTAGEGDGGGMAPVAVTVGSARPSIPSPAKGSTEGSQGATGTSPEPSQPRPSVPPYGLPAPVYRDVVRAVQADYREARERRVFYRKRMGWRGKAS